MEGTVVITGGGRGIGAAVAKMLAPQHHLLLVYRSNREAAEEIAAACREHGGTVRIAQGDVGEAGGVAAVFAALDGMPRLVGLVNNAGILGPRTPLSGLSDDDLTRIFATNALGPIRAAREAVRRMSTASGAEGGSIVNVSSVLARLGAAGEYVHYAATKGAVEAFTLGLSREVAAEGIRVNAVRPGLTRTEMIFSPGDEERMARVTPNIPMQRVGEPEEIAAAISWLMSPAASYVTGAVLDVGGGR
ncbi:MAG: SDR family oxidoreductase [Pseudomonadota bacterium]